MKQLGKVCRIWNADGGSDLCNSHVRALQKQLGVPDANICDVLTGRVSE